MEILTNTPGSSDGSHRITDIRAALRDENRVNIYIDGKFSFSLDLSQVVDYKVKVGKRLEPSEIDKLKRASAFGILYQRTLEWVFIRPRSIRETRDHLRARQLKRTLENRRRAQNLEKPIEERRQYKLPTRQLPEILDEDIEAVIARLTEKSYLDDEKFARYFVENRNFRKGTSMLRLRQELAKKGIDKSIIDNIFSESPRDERAEISKIIAKKRSRYDDHKLTQYLLRQGFSYDLIREVLQ